MQSILKFHGKSTTLKLAADLGCGSGQFTQLLAPHCSTVVASDVSKAMLGKVMGDTRRALSVTIVRANALCLLERLSQLGPGAGAAAKRRQVAVRLEERRRQDRQAFDLAWQARGAS